MRNHNRRCDYCGKPYEGRGEQYCGAECRSKAANGYWGVDLCDIHHEAGKPLVPAFYSILNFLKARRPHFIVLKGDVGEWGMFSPHMKKQRLLKEGLRYKDDCVAIREDIIEPLIPLADRVEWIMGNHEEWVVKFVEENPEVEGQIDLPKDLGLDHYGIHVTPYNEVLSINKLNFAHGWYCNKHHAAKHLDVISDHIFYGHTHDHQSDSKITRTGRNPYIGMSTGCLCNQNPYWLRNRPNNWLHGFGIYEVRGNGEFTPHFIPIIDGVFSYGGEVWRA